LKKACILLALLLFLALPNIQAQQAGELTLAPGESRLFYLAEEGLIAVQLTVQQAPIYFRVSTSQGVQVESQLISSNGSTQQLNSTSESENTLLLQSEDDLPANDYTLELAATEGYLKVEYRLTPFETLPTGEQTFTGDAVQVAFYDPFSSNDNNWALRGTETTVSGIQNDSLIFQLIGPGATLSGFNLLPGTEQPSHYISTRVDIQGDTADSAFGLILRLVDSQNFIVFQVAPELGAWRAIALQNGIWTPLTEWLAEPSILGASGGHQIAAWILQDTILFIWDGQPVGHLAEAPFSTGGAGLFVEVAPQGTGTPSIEFQEFLVGVPPTGTSWPIFTAESERVEPAAQIEQTEQAEQTELPEQTEEPAAVTIPDLTSQIVGVWLWEDEADSIRFAFSPDGSFIQTIIRNSAESVQTGEWQVEENTILVLEIEDLPSQRYHPTLEENAMTLPELNNREFVRQVEG
jgi:hypothetical protein